MAIAVIGGLLTSTLLTLVVVPVIFTYLDRLQVVIFGKLLKGPMKRRSEDTIGANERSGSLSAHE